MANLLGIVKQEMELRNYSPKTIVAYLGVIKDLYKFYQKPLKNLTAKEIKGYLYAKQQKNLSSQTIALAANALNFLYTQIYQRKDFERIKHPKRTQKLPEVLNQKEIMRILNNISNIKHKLMISLAYGAGLRVSEVVRLKCQDIDFDDLIIKVRQGKGKKDRITLLPESVKDGLQKFIAGKEAKDYVFMSERGGRLSEAAAQKVFYSALKNARIKNQLLFIHCATALPRTCWKMALMSGMCRNFWGIRISGQPKFILK